MRVAILVVLFSLIAGILIGLVTGAREDQVLDQGELVSTFTVRTDRDRIQTYGRFWLYVDSQIVVTNETGNQSLVVNQGRISVSLYDVDHDVIIREFTVPFFLGRAEIPLVVEPIWTSAFINISVIDFEHGLRGYALVETFMSDEYLVYLIRSEWFNEFRKYAQELRTAADLQIWYERILMALFAGTTIFLFFVLFMRADHRRSRRVSMPSYFDRFSSFIWPFTLIPDEFPVWLDLERTWDQDSAKFWISRRRAWAVRRLKEEAEELQNEISGVLTGRLGT